MPEPSIFISYSQKDERRKDQLVQQLRVLEMQGAFRVWHDGLIQPGVDWFPAIQKEIQVARVAILLVSADFLTSEFVNHLEIPQLLQRRRDDRLLVIPVILRTCAWEEVPWLSAIQAYPRGRGALAGLSS